MKKISTGILAASCVATIISLGCTAPGLKKAYPGADQPAQALATVQGTTNEGYRMFSPTKERISISRVDDDNTVPWYSFSPYPTAVQVLPGKRKLDVQFEHIHGVARGPIWVDARSNHVYQIKVMNPQARTERVYFVIEDITSQTLVGGSEPATP